MSLTRRLLLLLAVLSGIGLVLFAVVGQMLIGHWVEANLLESAERVRAVLMATRRVYHHQFIDSGLPLNEKTLGFLPAHAMRHISQEIKTWDRSGFSFNNVSDQPRNPFNQADAVEMAAIADFRAHPEKELRFVSYTSATGQPYYLYARPIRVEKYCLQCHGKREQAPPTIREHYADAYGYVEGDLRGILSIKVPAAPIEAQARESLHLLLGGGVLILGLLAVGIGWSARRHVVRPLAALERHIEAVAAGDLTQRVGDLPGEFGSVGLAFNSMARNIEHEHDRRQESESRFEATFEQAAVGIALVAPDGHWLRVNRKLCEIVGYSEAELLSTTFQDITHPDDLDADLDQVRRMLAREIDSYAMEKRYLRKDGSLVWIKLSVALAWKPNGAPSYFISVVEDIQARKVAEQALQASETNLREAQRLAGLGHWTWDVARSCHFWSAEIYAIYGRDPAMPPAVYPEVQGYFTPESWAQLAVAVEQCRNVGTPYECEAEVVRPDGVHRWITARGEAVRDAAGKVIELRGTVQDITVRKVAEAALRESQERLQLLIDHAPAALAMFDRDMCYLAVSQRWRDDYGLGGRDLLGQSHYVVFPDIGENWKAAHRRGLDGEIIRADDDCFERADGSAQWLRWEVRPWHAADGTVGGIVIFSEDITRHKLAEIALRDSEHRFRRLFQEAPLPLCYVDNHGLLADRNQRFDQTFGYSHEELRSLDDWWPLAYPDPAYRAWVLDTWNAAVADAVAANRDIEPIEYRVCCKNGDTRTLLVSGIVVGEDFLATFYDVTERRQAEEALRELNASLERRVTERTAELSAANQELDAFAYAVSHDLRAPLRAMSGFAQALEEDFNDQLHGEAKTYLEQINLASRKMSELIDGILSLSRSTRGEMRRDPVDLGEMATRLLQQLAQAEPGRQVAVDVSDGLLARGDARMLEAALANLLGNAWKYTARATDANIRVYAEARDDGRWFCVADNGAGFDMAHAERLFKPFQRLHRQEEFPGIGIGLATVQRIIQRHGGRIEAHGEVGKGAVFCFSLTESEPEVAKEPEA